MEGFELTQESFEYGFETDSAREDREVYEDREHNEDREVYEDGELYELAAELLSVANEEELDLFLGKVFKKIGRFAGKVMKPLGKVLKGVASVALPIAGKLAGSFFGGPLGGMVGGQLGSLAGKAIGNLEAEGFEHEARDVEAAKRFVELVMQAAQNYAGKLPAQAGDAAAVQATRQAAEQLASKRRTAPSGGGAWRRKGRALVIDLAAQAQGEISGEEREDFFSWPTGFWDSIMDVVGQGNSSAAPAPSVPRLPSAPTTPAPSAPSAEAQIIDVTSKSDKSLRKGDRDMSKVYALVLHQMACCAKRPPTGFNSLTAHFAILRDGTILQVHPLKSLLWASNGFNNGSVAVEFAGNFPSTRGTWWEGQKMGRDQVTPAQIEAGRRLVRYLVKTMGLTTVLAHRQSSNTRENDPGPDLWYGVGQWAVDKLGLSDGGPGFKVGTGAPIPDEWRRWGTLKPSGTQGASANAAAPPASPSGVTDWTRVSEDQRMRYVMNRLVNTYRYPVNAAAGIVGNLYAESGVIPNRIEGSSSQAPMRAKNFSEVVTSFTADQVMNRNRSAGSGPKLAGAGLAQWTSSPRRENLFKHRYNGQTLGANILFSMDAQVDYLVTELKGAYASVNAVLTKPGVTLNEASDEVVYRFEVPGAVLSSGKLRPRTDPAVQAVFAKRRGFAQRALRAFTP